MLQPQASLVELATMDDGIVAILRADLPGLLALYRYGSAGWIYERPASDVDMAVLAHARLAAGRQRYSLAGKPGCPTEIRFVQGALHLPPGTLSMSSPFPHSRQHHCGRAPFGIRQGGRVVHRREIY